MRGRSTAAEGVLLVATGERHRVEALEALPRLRPHLGGRPVWLVCDAPEQVPADRFERVLPHPDPRHGFRDKIPPLLRLPFPRTLLLDTDVELLAPLEDVFALLRSLDLVGCHAPVRWCQWQDPEVPEGFCELNSGVLGFRRSRLQHRLVRRWLTTYDKVGVPFDQASLRSALWWATQRGLRSWILPPEYNLRTTKPWIAGQGMAVKVVHGRLAPEIRAPLAAYLNDHRDRFRASSAFPTGQNAAVAPWPPIPPKRLFILGAGRSGTSLVAGLFRHSGLFMGDSPYRPREANPHGFFEDREVNAINEALLAPLVSGSLGEGQRWLACLPSQARVRMTTELRRRILVLYARGSSCFKDPRFCYTLPAWLAELPPEERQQALQVCVFRNPAVVATSVLRELDTAPYLSNLHLEADQVLASWAQHYRHVLEQQHSQEGRWLFVHYDSMFDPAGLERLAAFTGLPIDRDLVDPSLRRSRAEVEPGPACARLYRELLDLAAQG